MNNDIRPMSQTPTVVNNEVDIHRNSWRDSPKSSKGHLVVEVDAVTKVKGTLRNADYENAYEVGPDDGIDWKPGFKHRFPWVGFAGLLTVILATAMAVAILVQSDRKRVKDWPIERFPTQPNVLLNIANQVQNLGLITLIAQGLAIAWWRKALRGSSLKTLHQNHAYSHSFYAIITSGKHFNLIALAALMTKFAIIDSTLFQKATKTIITQQVAYANASMTGWIETDWISNSGGVPGDEGNIKTIDAAWASVIDAYNGKIANGKVHDSLEGNASFFGCPFRQECSGALKGLGFAFNCSTSVEIVDYGLQRQSQQGGILASYPLWDISFNSSWASDTKPYASILLDMLYVDSHASTASGSCPGTITRRSCEIRPAVVQYPVTVMMPSEEELRGKNIVTHIKFFDDKTYWPISSPLNEHEQIDSLKVLEYVDLDEHFGETSTIGALTYVMNNLYSSSANLTYENDWDIEARGASAQTTFFADTDTEDFSRCWYDIDKAGKDDPAVELLRKINTLSFVAGLYLKGAPAIDVKKRAEAGMSSQAILTSVTGIVEEYVTSFAYVAGALAATFITLLLVLPVYWGFWQLGRKVTLGPLEISHAFGAPILAPERTKAHHGEFDVVLEEVGHRRVQYGQRVDAPPGHMGIAEPDMVTKPRSSDKWRVGRSNTTQQIGISAAVGGIIAATVGGHARA
ncbi:uncharacterized protein K460DRAFT_351185 [Cucurbitaria berberidis CBS 394.84]|uniref:Uncharacterized protein n=1 Tax=Cucurbitaria berberidis CBS 394.84 TaxID=1168544 RepID=A0A9P4GTV6_9PLEO|nr:uncharacterized protein K460DRAFT_351185 [Cucurbitaria berberidis CBS 394.84]KAF1851232.1 hypothetical protein K460DRAFT_351185 [Cucurbitaria berberidis CBS 394.84]